MFRFIDLNDLSDKELEELREELDNELATVQNELTTVQNEQEKRKKAEEQ